MTKGPNFDTAPLLQDTKRSCVNSDNQNLGHNAAAFAWNSKLHYILHICRIYAKYATT